MTEQEKCAVCDKPAEILYCVHGICEDCMDECEMIDEPEDLSHYDDPDPEPHEHFSDFDYSEPYSAREDW